MSSDKQKRWLSAPEVPPLVLQEYDDYCKRYHGYGMSPVLAQVLHNRGFTTPQEAYEFINGQDTRHNPFQLTDIGKAVGRIRQAIKSDEPIVVYGDFDADGVTSTTLMVQGLRALGARNVKAYIPNRVDEGYGLNIEAIDKLGGRGCKLIITVDCGIRSIDEVDYAQEQGLDVIVTDHHSLGPDLPPAYAVINCKRPGYMEDMLAGVGVAYKLIAAPLQAAMNNGRSGQPPLDLTSLLDLVAIGPVADLMPLNRLENRSLVAKGLDVLRRAERPGIRALLDVAQIAPENVDTGSIGFALGPRINAAGRLADAMQAYELLSAESYDKALPLAMRLQELNVLRQEKTRQAQDVIRAQIEDTTGVPLIFASHESLESGIVGLVAGRMVEEYFLPAIIMEQGPEESRASCRSIHGFDITGALDQCQHLLVRHGGHALAAGFTVRNQNIPALREMLTDIARQALHGKELMPTLEIDAVLDVHQVDESLVEELRKLEPCGNANRPPVFMIRRAHLIEARTVGKEEKHLKLRIARAGQQALDAIGFNLGHKLPLLNGFADLAFTLEINEWRDRRTVQLKLEDVRPYKAGA
jgi:single-stranded-DNA-specific exonuclease